MRLSHPTHRAHGGALFIVVVLVLLAASSLLATSGRVIQQAQHRADAHSLLALSEAKAALLGYAVAYPENHPGQGPGYLPCPDSATTGSAPGVACHARDHGAFGRLPWRTLGLDVPLDGRGQCLWYAVAGAWKHNPKTLSLNWDTPGQFRIVDPSGRPLGGEGFEAVAVILAPGAPLPGQRRPSAPPAQRCPGSNVAAADLPLFLDRPYNTDLTSNTIIVQKQPHSDVNDIVAWITTDEIFDIIRRRPDFSGMLDQLLDSASIALTSQTTQPDFIESWHETALGNRAAGRLPNAATLGVSPNNVALYNNWRDQLRFVLCTDATACLPVTLLDSSNAPATSACRAVVLFGGERRRNEPTQHRRTADERANPSQYLEGENLTSYTTGMGGFTGHAHYTAAAPSRELIRCIR